MLSSQNKLPVKHHPYEKSLLIDLHLLELLLGRNQKQHYRAQYYRRLEMVLRSTKRHNILSDDSISSHVQTKDSPDRFGRTLHVIRRERDRIGSMINLHKGIKNKYEDEQWTLSSSKSTIGNKQSLLIQGIERMHELLEIYIPEIISRIFHAASSLYTELSRGYFVPFCTATLACISRIRISLMGMGREGSIEVQQTLDWMSHGLWANLSKNITLENRIGFTFEISVKTVKKCALERGSLNMFIDVDADSQDKIIQERMKKATFKRCGVKDVFNNILGESSCKQTTLVKKGEDIKNTQSDDEPSDRSTEGNKNSNENDTGMCVEDSGYNNSFDQSEKQKIPNGNSHTLKKESLMSDDAKNDKNYDVLIMLKNQKKSGRNCIDPKKGKKQNTKREEPTRKTKEVTKDLEESSILKKRNKIVNRNVVIDSEKKKKKRKITKKKKNANFFDDLFD